MSNLLNTDSNSNGIFRAYMIHTSDETRVYVPGTQSAPLNKDGTLNNEMFLQNKDVYPIARWCSQTMRKAVPDTTQPCWVIYEGGDSKRPVIIGFLGNGLKAANAWFTSSISGAGGIGGSGIYLNKKYDKYILIGDSRGVGMYKTQVDKSHTSSEIIKVVDNTHWICKGGAAYDWMLEAFSLAESSITENSVIVNMMGFNNCSPKSGTAPNNGAKYYAPKYASAINEKVNTWKEKGADVVFCSVNAMHDDNYINFNKEKGLKDLSYRNSEVILFNDTIKPLLDSSVTYLDTYTLTYSDITGSNGPSDGIHYGYTIHEKIYNSIMGVGGETGAISEITDDLKQYVKLTNTAEVTLDDLRCVTVQYHDYYNNISTGMLIVHKDVAQEIAQIFSELFNINYPIQCVKPITEYDNDDWKSIEANNTSAFCDRAATGSTSKSKHACGKAIDINPFVNPYVYSGTNANSKDLSHKGGAQYYSRDTSKWKDNVQNDISADMGKKSYIGSDTEIVKIFKKYGWKWGGDWSGNKDYQHFQKDN